MTKTTIIVETTCAPGCSEEDLKGLGRAAQRLAKARRKLEAAVASICRSHTGPHPKSENEDGEPAG